MIIMVGYDPDEYDDVFTNDQEYDESVDYENFLTDDD